MASKRQRQTEYERLKKIWYAKLKKEGFVDIEDPNPNLTRISNSDAFNKDLSYGNQHSFTWQRSKEEYYNMATYFLNHYKFQSNLDRIIWEYYSVGLGSYAIMETLRRVEKKITIDKVKAIISRLQKIMIVGSYEEIDE